MSEPLSDVVLVERAAQGDEIAFSELVNRHYQRALRVAYGLMKDQHDAEDIVQDAFAKVYTRLSTFEGNSSFYTWLYRIVVNLSIDTIRKHKRQRRANVDGEEARDALRSRTEELWPRYDDSEPHANIERLELSKRLENALGSLPDIHQAVLLLRDVEGFSYEDIAVTLNIKKGTVMSRLFHARKSMQSQLSQEENSGTMSTERAR
ncbi:sigma-70 family RNA polymerase sigma factor [Myxococcota bacterium]|nr:sigma-70 family RNA polymerase sigma factor [Myxococcota bacterium]